MQLPAGKLILSDIFYLERSDFVLRGAGVGAGGTKIFCPRPMLYFEDPASLKELREYLIQFDKRQREKENNIDLPFSQYAWSGGIIWTQVPGERVKSYLGKYDVPQTIFTKISSGKRGEFILEASEKENLFLFETPNKKSLALGFDFLFPFIKDKNSWSFKKDVMYWDDWPVRSAALLFGGLVLQNEDYLKTWESLNSNFNKVEIIRNVPIRFPLLWVK